MTGAFPLQPARGAVPPADPAGVRVPAAGRVLERVDDETWLVEVAGNQITIQTPEALEPGARVLVLLGTRDTDAVLVRPRTPAGTGAATLGAQPAPQTNAGSSQAVATLPLLLAALAASNRSPAPASASRLMDAVLRLARSGQMPEDITRRLLQLLTPLPSRGDTRAIADTIRQQMEHGGLLLEAHVARMLTQGSIDVGRLSDDLRAALGRMVALLELEEGAPADSQQTSSAATTAARDLARQTLVTQLQTAADVARQGIWRFDLSLMLTERAVPVAVEWEPDRESQSDGRGAARRGRVSVFVEVAASGIEARIAWSQATLQVDLFAGSDAIRDRLLVALDDLRARLSAIGFSHIITNAWTNPARLARWRLGASPDARPDGRVFEAEA